MSETWTILKMINWLTTYLQDKGVSEARLNAEHLIAHSLNLSRMDIYLQFERVLSKEELNTLKQLIERRKKREPLQYIMGSQPFRHVNIEVDRNVLIPRPETEILVEEVLSHTTDGANMDILELGVGSGAVIAALASENTNTTFTGTEISSKALKIAEKNTAPFKGRVSLLLGDLFEPVVGKTFDIAVSNPPYISTNDWSQLAPEVRDFEPKESLVAGEDGLDFYRRILNDIEKYLKPDGWLIMEMGDGQKESIMALIAEKTKLQNIRITKDLNQKERVISAQYIGGDNG